LAPAEGRESSEEEFSVLAETLAMIGRLWGALYRHEVARMPWCTCYVMVSKCSQITYATEHVMELCKEILFTSLILGDRFLAINN